MSLQPSSVEGNVNLRGERKRIGPRDPRRVGP